MLKSLKKRKLKHFSYPVVANYRFDTTLNGKSIEQVNLIKGRKHKAKAEAEDAKIGVRNVRKDSNNEIKKLEKDENKEWD